MIHPIQCIGLYRCINCIALYRRYIADTLYQKDVSISLCVTNCGQMNIDTFECKKKSKITQRVPWWSNLVLDGVREIADSNYPSSTLPRTAQVESRGDRWFVTECNAKKRRDVSPDTSDIRCIFTLTSSQASEFHERAIQRYNRCIALVSTCIYLYRIQLYKAIQCIGCITTPQGGRCWGVVIHPILCIALYRCIRCIHCIVSCTTDTLYQKDVSIFLCVRRWG